MRIYLAAAMSKYKDSKVDPWNFGTFHYAAQSLRSKGHEVVNPAESFGGDTTLEWSEYLKHDIPQLCTCDAVVLLGDDWQESKGAMFEARTAKTLGIKTLDIDLNPVHVPSLEEELQAAIELRKDWQAKAIEAEAHNLTLTTKRETGGYKVDAGKTRYSLLYWPFMRTIAEVMTEGAKKYPAHNWAKGMEWSRTFDALHRHIMAFAEGELTDPESGRSHLAHAACCLMFLFAYTTNERYNEFNNLHGGQG
jgi:hypothetical protein